MRKLAVLFLLVFLCCEPAGAADMTAAEIVGRCWDLYRQAKDEKETIQVTIFHEDGRQEQKALQRWIKYDQAGEDKVTIKFSSPPMDDGLGLLTWRHPGDGDDQWLKLPSMRQVRRISASDQGKYFAGTDLTYEDSRQLMGERLKDFQYALLRREQESYIIEAKPREGTASAYERRILWINSRFQPEKIEYYGAGGTLIKTQENREIQTSGKGLWRAGLIEIRNQLLKRRTVLKVTARELDTGLGMNLFDKRFLESERGR